jgi:hypothetical protein
MWEVSFYLWEILIERAVASFSQAQICSILCTSVLLLLTAYDQSSLFPLSPLWPAFLQEDDIIPQVPGALMTELLEGRSGIVGHPSHIHLMFQISFSVFSLKD